MTIGKISATAVRFIKLGWHGNYERAALEDRRLYLGYHSVPHETCRKGDWDAVNRHFLNEGHKAHVATNHNRQVQDFYEQLNSCLRITFIDDDMWWTFANGGVRMCQNWKKSLRERRGPSRYRSCLEFWRNTNINGRQLRMRQLSGYVTKTASGFRGTTCQIKNVDAVLRIINDEIDPGVKQTIACREALVENLEKVIKCLYWKDFETLVDLIFQRSGWPRITPVGGSQRLIEFELENPVTGERSFAQVKSQARQAALDDYVERFERDAGYKQMFFVCHTAKGGLHTEHPDIIVWTGPRVADMTVRTGLADWVLEKAQ